MVGRITSRRERHRFFLSSDRLLVNVPQHTTYGCQQDGYARTAAASGIPYTTELVHVV